MRNIYDPNKYNTYKSTSTGPSGSGWTVIIIIILALISIISDGANGEEISMLLGLGIIAYMIFK